MTLGGGGSWRRRGRGRRHRVSAFKASAFWPRAPPGPRPRGGEASASPRREVPGCSLALGSRPLIRRKRGSPGCPALGTCVLCCFSVLARRCRSERQGGGFETSVLEELQWRFESREPEEPPASLGGDLQMKCLWPFLPFWRERD